MFWYWFFVGPALLLAILSLRGERKRAAYVERRLAETPHRPAARHRHRAREGRGRRACAKISPPWPRRIIPTTSSIVVAHSAADIPPGVLPNNVHVVLAHGDDPSTGEKVRNLKAAVAAARKFSRVFAFADSDGRVTPRWLRSLVAPLAEKGVGASTGYRWFAPMPPTFWTLMRSVWDAVALSRLGPGDCSFAWGGAMAIRRETFHDLDIREPLEEHRQRRLRAQRRRPRRRVDHRVRSRGDGACHERIGAGRACSPGCAAR